MKVVTLLLDTLRYDFMGFNSNQWITPNMDRLAASSIVFDKAYLGSYPCMPARRDLWTGKFEFPFRGWGPLEYDDEDLAKVLTVHKWPRNPPRTPPLAGNSVRRSDAANEPGLTSMLITDHYHLWERGSGNYHFDFSGYEFIRGQEYDKWRVEPGGRPNPVEGKQVGHLSSGYFELNQRNVKFREIERDYFPAMLMTRAADWVEKNRERENFFLLIDCFDPHEPFDPPQHYVDMYDPDYEGEEIVWPTYGWNRLTERETEHVRALYAGELTMTDRWVGYLLDKLEQLQLMDDTMIILATDHGHMLGEHGLMGKPWSAIADSNMYEEVSHVPLVIYHPKLKRPGRRISDLVQLVDLYPTILEAFEIESPAGIHGKSLMPYVLGEDNGYRAREVACYGRFGEALHITDGEWSLFIWPPSEENGPLYWYSQLPPQSQYGAFRVVGPKNPRQSHDRWPVACARGEMQTQLFNVKRDPRQLDDQTIKHPEIVEHLKRCAVRFLQSIEAPPEQLERLGLANLS
jgi:arylsulfatase A-like enzyme